MLHGKSILDRLVVTPNRINTIAATFTYTIPKAISGLAVGNKRCRKIGVYPSPYYAYNPAETNRFFKFVTFNNLPKSNI